MNSTRARSTKAGHPQRIDSLVSCLSIALRIFSVGNPFAGGGWSIRCGVVVEPVQLLRTPQDGKGMMVNVAAAYCETVIKKGSVPLIDNP